MGGGLGGIALVILFLVLGGDPAVLLQQARQQAPGGGGAAVAPQAAGADKETRDFVAVVLADTEDVWGRLFEEQLGREYARPPLVLFSGRVESACGLASAATGPFYCPADRKVYLDLSFFDELRTRFGAPGDFAMAYVVAHEVGHHVQNLLGPLGEVHRRQRTVDKVAGNRLSVRLELQADYLAGVWAHHAQEMKQILEEGDVEEALRAASAIGDDTLQEQAQGTVRPDAFTHGTSAQRLKWFRRGLETGRLDRMNDLFELPYDEL